MTYSIKAVADKTGLSIYTLRFYDKQGLLPFVSRNAAGYRVFTDGDLHLLHTICCLKDTGMKIADIRQYIAYVMQGPTTIPQRQHLLSTHRQAILDQQAKIMQNLQEVDFKLNLYRQPNAQALVTAELAVAQAEKRANGLPNPFEK
ncbi:MerR family transcriptional regulator [Lactiplantibacillus daowaiensis]|uniref:MerR family transcriptional regulator n=1 Tax=Lactiplantibacillus daowaiensis TaxID=2559918 RepID=A0ABW1RYV3_9LACO|nr:MerR family transcriptional regulator [Lactiplantibacillus daowaiensis]